MNSDNSSNITLLGNDGDDYFSVNNISIDRYGGSFYIHGDNVDSSNRNLDSSVETGKDTINISNASVVGYGNTSKTYLDVSGNADNDVISISDSEATYGGHIHIYAGGGDDKVTAQNTKGVVTLFGGEGNDTITAKSTTIEQIYGDDGNDIISVDDFAGGIYAGAGTDSISITNRQEGDTSNTEGGTGDDTIDFHDTWMGGYNWLGGHISGDDGDADSLDGSDLIIARNATIAAVNIMGQGGNDTIYIHDSTVNTGTKYFQGGTSNDTISFSNSTIKGGDFQIYGDEGNDTISIENLTYDAEEYSPRFNIYGNGRYTTTLEGSDFISLKNIDSVIGSLNIYGNIDNDVVYIDNVKLGGFYTSYGSSDNVGSGDLHVSLNGGSDSISVSNIELNKGRSNRVEIVTGDGADTISVDGVTLGDENDGNYVQSRLSIKGGADSDVIDVANVSVTGGYSRGYVEGDAGADKITVTDSNGLQITSGDGNDTLTFGGEVDATITDFSTTDAIKLNDAVERGIFEDGLLTLGNVKLTLNDVTESNISSYANIAVTNGTTSTTLGDLVRNWTISNGTATYRNLFRNLITITGLSSEATLDDINVEGTTVTLSANALDSSKTVTISSGYNLAVTSDVTLSTTIPAVWNVSEGTANYIGEGSTAGYTISNNQISYRSEVSGSTLVTVTGLKSTATASQLSLSGKVVTVSASAVTKGSVTISSGYALTLGSGNYATGASVVGSSSVDTITNNGNRLVISTGVGNDLITLGSGTSRNTIIGGKGNDSLTTSQGANIYKYASGDGKDVITGFSANDTLQISSGSYTTANSGNDVVVSVGSGSITLKDAKGVSLNIAGGTSTLKTVTDSDSSPVTVDSKVKGINASSRSKAVKISGNSLANSIVGGSGADSLSGLAGIDTLNGGKGNDTLTGGAGNDVFIYQNGQGNDVITDYAVGDKISITGSKVSKASVSGSDVVLTVGSGKLTVKNGKGKSLSLYNNSSTATTTVIGGTSSNSTLVTVTNATKSLVTVGSAVKTINAAARTTAVRISGNALANSIVGGSDADSLSGLAGADTLNGGKGNDTLTGGVGNDVFIYQNGQGNDVVTDYAAGDRVSITGGKYTRSTVGNDVKFTVGTGSILLKNAKTKTITVIGTSTTTTNTTTSTSVTLTNSTTSPYTAASTVKNINASSRTTAIKIAGNSLANSITGGSGADSLSGLAGADTLNGGKGNDTLTGGAGNDVFFYQSGQGVDVITDYATGDKIKISGAKISKTSVSGSDVILTVGSGSVRVKNGKNKSLSIYNNSTSATTTVIGSSSSNYEERWFLEDDNFSTKDELNSILSTSDYADNSLGQVNMNYDASSLLNQKQPQVVTYSQDKK